MPRTSQSYPHGGSAPASTSTPSMGSQDGVSIVPEPHNGPLPYFGWPNNEEQLAEQRVEKADDQHQ